MRNIHKYIYSCKVRSSILIFIHFSIIFSSLQCIFVKAEQNTFDEHYT